MSHPFEKIPAAKRCAVMWALAGTTVVLLAVLGSLYGPLKNETAPQGMVSLELARSQEHLGQMFASWNEDTRMRLAFSLGLNFLCLFALTNTLAMACVWIAGATRGSLLGVAGILLAWGQWFAGAFWAVQNSLLSAALFGHATDFTLAIASSFAILKFTLVSAGLLYVVLAGIRAAVMGQSSRTIGIRALPASKSK